jgi:hypothetical protein
MAKVWVKACSLVRVEEGGRLATKYPGDWFQVGKHDARKLLAEGKAEIPREDVREEVEGLDRCGVLVRTERAVPVVVFGELERTLRFKFSPQPALPFEMTFIWTPGVRINERAVKAGFASLMDFEGTGEEAWEVIAMLASETALARDVGSIVERRKTRAAVGDLRLPVYDTGALWVRRTPATLRVVGRWADGLLEGADERHAFLRALYSERAMTRTLGPDWCARFADFRR